MPEYGSFLRRKLIEYTPEFLRSPISVDKLMEKYKGTDNEEKMRCIFSNFDLIDNEETTEVRDGFIHSDFIHFEPDFYENFDDPSHYGYVSQKKIDMFGSFKGKNITVEDVDRALQDLCDELETRRQARNAEIMAKKNTQKLSGNSYDLPNNIVEFYGDAIEEFKPVIINDYELPEGDVLIRIQEHNGFSYHIFHEGSSEDEQVGYFENFEVDENTMDRRCLKSTKLIQPNGNTNLEEFKYNSGLSIKLDWNSNSYSKQFKKTEFFYSNNQSPEPENPQGTLDKVVINSGLPNELVITINNGQAIVENNNLHNISQANLDELISYINSGAEIGTDFDIEYQGNGHIEIKKFS